jgi:hypothetical protein
MHDDVALDVPIDMAMHVTVDMTVDMALDVTDVPAAIVVAMTMLVVAMATLVVVVAARLTLVARITIVIARLGEERAHQQRRGEGGSKNAFHLGLLQSRDFRLRLQYRRRNLIGA